MYEKLLRALRAMELEEKILNAGALFCIFTLFFPWLGGQGVDGVLEWNGFDYYTGYMGHFVFLACLFILASAVSPMLGGPVLVRKSRRSYVRLVLTSLNTLLLVFCFTILLRYTWELSRAEIRFGIYFSIVSSAIATLYAWLSYQEEMKSRSGALFQHPDESAAKPKPAPEPEVLHEERPPMPPPPPLQPEDHQITPGRS